jgi:nucleoid-associated protein YgaU
MPTRSSGRESILKRSPGLWILLIALVGGAIGSAPAVEPAPVPEPEPLTATEEADSRPETETPTSQPTEEAGSEATPEAPPQSLDELQHRLQGMEGKLRESALARKSADQARMEAERRLAENMQALEALRAAHAELEQRLSDCESARTRLTEALQHQTTANRTLYEVRPSDNLASISLRVYGRADQWPAIFEANRHLLDDPDRLTPGITLVIP